jgi:hypothetical protein
VRGLAMPHVELVDMKQENRFRRGVHLFSQRLDICCARRSIPVIRRSSSSIAADIRTSFTVRRVRI